MGLKLRKASMDDAGLLFEWANEAAVRNNSFSTEAIRYEDHLDWLSHKLKADTCSIYIAMEGSVPIGQVRIDVESDRAVIDYSIDVLYRKKGYGTLVLSLLEECVREEYPEVKNLTAQVKYNNKASLRAFQKTGFEESFVELVKLL